MHKLICFTSSQEIEESEDDFFEHFNDFNDLDSDYCTIVEKGKVNNPGDIFQTVFENYKNYSVEKHAEEMIEKAEHEKYSISKGYYYRQAGCLLEGRCCENTVFLNIDEMSQEYPSENTFYSIVDYHY